MLLLTLLLAAATVGCSTAAGTQGGLVQPPRPAFALSGRNWDDREFHLGDQKGHVVVLFFGYTSCPDVCPNALAKMRSLYQRLGSRARDVAVVFVSIDPERDTTARLSSYVAGFDARFFGVRIEPDALPLVEAGFDLTVKKRRATGGLASYYIDHTSSFYAIDRQGRLCMRLPTFTPVDDFLARLEPLLAAKDPEAISDSSRDSRTAGSGARVYFERPRAHQYGGGGVVYFTLINRSSDADRLLSVETTAAAEASLHETFMEGDVARMVSREGGVEVGAHSAVEFKPGGKHVMLLGMNTLLGPGQEVSLKLHFEKAGTLELTAPITSAID